MGGGVTEAEDEGGCGWGDGHAAWLGDIGDGRGENEAVDEVVVGEGAGGVVLDRGQCGVDVGGGGRYLGGDVQMLLKGVADVAEAGFVVDVVVVWACHGDVSRLPIRPLSLLEYHEINSCLCSPSRVHTKKEYHPESTLISGSSEKMNSHRPSRQIPATTHQGWPPKW